MLKAALTKLTKNSLIYGLGGILQRFMSLLLLPFFTRVMSPEDYGVISLISLMGVAVSGILTLGTGNSMSMLYFREHERSKRFAVIWTNVSLLTFNGLFWYLLFFIISPSISEMMFQTKHYADFIRVSLLGSVLAAIADPWLAYLRMEEKAKRYVFITFIGSILSISMSVWLVLFMHLGVRGMVLGGTIAYAILLLVIWVTVARHLDFVVDISLFRPLVRIGFPSIFGLFAFLCIDYIDRQMIERMLGLTELGIYSIGCGFGMVMTVATGAFATAWPPFFMSYIQNRTEARQVFARVLTYYVIGFGSLVVLFFCVAKPVVLLMTAPAFYDAYLVIGLVAAGYALKGCYLIILPGIFFAEKLYLQSIVEWVAAVINIVLNLWLIPLHGIVGAAIATLFSYLTLPVLAWMVSRYYLEVDYQWKRLMFASVVITVTAVFLFQVSVILNEGLVETIFVNMIMLIGFLSISYWFLLNNIERTQLRRGLKR